uniref:Cobalamin biosynthesis protein n=1 Tax=Steinernema glaseri TaxID=37863 RepID=A0A1I7YMW1_9BILA
METARLVAARLRQGVDPARVALNVDRGPFLHEGSSVLPGDPGLRGAVRDHLGVFLPAVVTTVAVLAPELSLLLVAITIVEAWQM